MDEKRVPCRPKTSTAMMKEPDEGQQRVLLSICQQRLTNFYLAFCNAVQPSGQTCTKPKTTKSSSQKAFGSAQTPHRLILAPANNNFQDRLVFSDHPQNHTLSPGTPSLGFWRLTPSGTPRPPASTLCSSLPSLASLLAAQPGEMARPESCLLVIIIILKPECAGLPARRSRLLSVSSCCPRTCLPSIWPTLKGLMPRSLTASVSPWSSYFCASSVHLLAWLQNLFLRSWLFLSLFPFFPSSPCSSKPLLRRAVGGQHGEASPLCLFSPPFAALPRGSGPLHALPRYVWLHRSSIVCLYYFGNIHVLPNDLLTLYLLAYI